MDETVQIVRDACHGLDYAHRAGVVHRDVKPGNLLLTEEKRTTKIADFGIAKAAELTRITQVGSVLGTAAYLSPEQAHGDEAGPASDIYSLGVCAYQFLTGRLPHEYGSLTELALKQQNDPITPITELRPEVPRALDRRSGCASSATPSSAMPPRSSWPTRWSAGLQGRDTGRPGSCAAGTLTPPARCGSTSSPPAATRALPAPRRVRRCRPRPAVPRATGSSAPPRRTERRAERRGHLGAPSSRCWP